MKLLKLSTLVLTLLAASLLISSPNLSAAPSAADEAAIKKENQRWADAWNRNDIPGVVDLYTDDARLLPDEQGPVAGHAAIAQYLQKIKDASASDTISFANFEFYGDGQSMAEYGEFEFRAKDGAVKARGKQVLIYVKKGGQWKLHRDIWTSSTPSSPTNQ